MATTELARRPTDSPARKGGAQQQKSKRSVRPKRLPEYLEQGQVTALIRRAPNGQAKLIMAVQWRAGLRISETLALEVADLDLDAAQPTLRVRQGKGHKDRLVEIHAELVTGFYGRIDGADIRRGRLFSVSRWTALRWTQDALARAVELGEIPPGRKVGTHTLRHSCARHWLANGVPLNVVSRWLGHAAIQTTLIYLQILPDPVGYMERVP